ncbi:uncharacterized protein EV420DRAFT_1180033 [Desarmillaria tabescens]|uniref:F-box domain-containing protein n=1 Tax=Armillaria tabescens TaxID=1929756 RepID=A0AA39NAV6_ARMTA|nr:uncharacterized protein EV420DRAFT_1180033 [Desarmillaria tabescens]KAK0462250.1 hypothetical protein EV420DRAFT_1180033 [Desarmillaria tabescens]
MHLLDLPHELLSLIVDFMDCKTLLSLCLTEKHILYGIAHRLLQQTVTVVFNATTQKYSPNIFSFDFRRLSAITSLSIHITGPFDFHLASASFPPVFTSMINIKHVHVSGGSGPFIRMILENTMASLVTLELNGCSADPQDFSEMMPITIRKLCISRCDPNVRFLLGPLSVEELEVHGLGMDGECMCIGVTLRRLTDAHLNTLKRICLVNICRDAGCRDVLHLMRVLETRSDSFSSLKGLVLDFPLPEDIIPKLIKAMSAFPVLKVFRIVSCTFEDGGASKVLPF